MFHKIDPDSKECKLPYCKDCGGAYQILLIVFVVIVFYFFFLRGAYEKNNVIHNDFMNLKVFDFDMLENCCSLWPLSHFVLFFVLGMLFPDCGIPLITLGIVWEGFETIVSSVGKEDRQWVRDKRSKGGSKKIEYSENWWAGSMKDILMNITGFVCGYLLVKTTGAKICFDGLNSNTKWCKKEECQKCG